MKRNRPQTEQRIIEAAIGLIEDAGFTDFGVNHIAARAGVDKVLIYRYFGGIEGLLEHIGRSYEFFPEARNLVTLSLPEFIEAYRMAMTEQHLSSALLDWVRLTENPLTVAFQRQRRTFWDDVRDQRRPDAATNALLEILAALPINAFSAETLSPLTDLLDKHSAKPKAKAMDMPKPKPILIEPEKSTSEDELPTNLL